MNKFLKRLLIAASALLFLYLLYFFGTGWNKRTDMVSATDQITEQNGTISFYAGPMSSIGYARSCKADYSGNAAYLTFYSAFGGLNGSVCSTSDFTISIPEACTEIYFPRGDQTFQKIWQKDPVTGVWHNCTRENIRIPAP